MNINIHILREGKELNDERLTEKLTWYDGDIDTFNWEVPSNESPESILEEVLRQFISCNTAVSSEVYQDGELVAKMTRN